MDSIFFHIDVNSAFLSWTAIDLKEQAQQQGTLDTYVDLRKIPSIIGGDSATRHGIVLAKSDLAKKHGINTAEPIVSAIKKCPNLTIAPPNHSSYSKHSHQLMNYLCSYCPLIEQVSIDECYMDFTPIRNDFSSPIEAATIIKNGVRDTFGFTVNVGISNRKVLAKMASDFKKPDLVHTLFAEEIETKMWPLPISSLLMCGRSSQETLKKLGITTIGELARCDKTLLQYHLKSHGLLLWEYANGIDSSTVCTVPAPAKGIGNSTTMPKDVTSIEEMKPVILRLSESVSKRLRSIQSNAGTITVEIKYANFHSCSHQMALDTPDNTTNTIYESSMELLKELWDGTPVRLLGIRATKLKEESAPVQLDLFSYQAPKPQTERNKKLDLAIDSIRQKYGSEAIVRGSLLKSPSENKVDKSTSSP